MPRNDTTAKELAALISRLQAERQEHLEAVAQIDATFEQFGITLAAKKRLGRPRKTAKAAKPGLEPKAAATPAKTAKKAKHKARRTFPVSGLDSVLAFVKQAGKKGVTTAEVVKYWTSEGRYADPYTTLSLLVTAKKLKKEKIEGAMGSRYTAA